MKWSGNQVTDNLKTKHKKRDSGGLFLREKFQIIFSLIETNLAFPLSNKMRHHAVSSVSVNLGNDEPKKKVDQRKMMKVKVGKV